MQRVEKIIELDAPVERVFDLLSDFESFPEWMQSIAEVRRTGRSRSRWMAAAAAREESAEWETETTVFEPDHHIAWRSVRGDVMTDGEIILQETRSGTTLMRFVLGYEPASGRFGATLSQLINRNPERQLEADLTRFARIAEGRGEARRPRDVETRPRASSSFERERVEARPRRERTRYETEFPHIEMRRDARTYREQGTTRAREMQRDHTQSEEYRTRVERARVERDRLAEREAMTSTTTSRAEHESQRRFDEALRDARRSQLEGQRRYNEDRERIERQRYRSQRDGQSERMSPRATGNLRNRPDEFDEPRRDARSLEDARRREAERRPVPPNRHALTPRERELDRAERRRLEPDAAREKAFRRGIDRLVDDGPSQRWRR
jgi:uncharacterized membrane protein